MKGDWQAQERVLELSARQDQQQIGGIGCSSGFKAAQRDRASVYVSLEKRN
jgi:hypothetical protein